MSIEVQRATVACGVCAAQVLELRRGRCWSCYTQWAELRPVGRGAACVVCSERRREDLRLMELHGRSLPICHSCASRVVKVIPLPPSIEAIRDALRRDRRTVDRRGQGIERRIFPRERRVGERREGPRGGAEPGIDMAAVDDLVIEIDEGDMEIIESTQVRERPQR